MGYEFECEDQPDLTIPEDTILKARLTEIKLREFEWTDTKATPPEKKKGQALEWWWEITDEQRGDGKYKGRKVKGQTDAKLSNHTRNKFRPWAEALLDREIPPGMRINTDDLVGLNAEISIGHRKDKKDPSKVYEQVDEVIPLVGSGAYDDSPPF